MHKLEVTLKQHTPLIHFQHDQEGATLRASEVKPKLDRFILTRLGEGKMTFEDIAENEKYQQRIRKLKESNPNKTNHEIGAMYAKEQKWLVGKGDKPALNYKMRISGNKKEIVKLGTKESILGDKKDGIWFENLSLTIHTLNNKLYDMLENKIPAFFATTNFGFRQSKGLGCFSIDKLGNKSYDFDLDLELKKINQIYYSKNYNYDPLQAINRDYQLLKSGRNHNGYKKSQIMEYFYSQDPKIRWEKRSIKLELKENHKSVFDNLLYNKGESSHNRIEHEDEKIRENEYFIRAILGLAEHFEFRMCKGKGYKDDKITINISSSDIKRFKSPLTFKVFNDKIYLIPEMLNEDILDKSFSFTLEYENKHLPLPVKTELFELETPQSFDLIDFLNTKLKEKYGWKQS